MATFNRDTSFESLKPLVSEAASRYGVPEDDVWNIIRAENSATPEAARTVTAASSTAVSPKQARGLMQVTPIALKDLEEQGLVPTGLDLTKLSIKDQIGVGTAYLSRIRKLVSDPNGADRSKVYAMYNAGPGARFRMDTLPNETQDYLKKANAMADSTTQSDSVRSALTVSSGGGTTGTVGGGSMSTSDLVGQLITGMTGQNKLLEMGAAAAKKSFDIARDLLSSNDPAQRAVVADASALAADSANTQYKQAKTIEEIQTLYGLNPNDVQSEIARSIADATSARDARVGVRAEYDRLNQVSMIDNPIGYIFAKLRLPEIAAKNNALADQEDLAIQNINTRTSSFQAVKQAVTANVADDLRNQQLKKADLDAKLANVTLDKERAKNVSQDAAHSLQVLQITDKMADNQRQTLGVIASLQDREESRRVRLDESNSRLAAKAEKDEEEARLNARLKQVSELKGLVEPVTVKTLKTLTNKKEQQLWAQAATSGSLGAGVQESVEFFLGHGSNISKIRQSAASVVLTAEKLATAGAGYQAAATTELAAKNQGKLPKAEEARTAGYEKYETEIVNSMASPTGAADLSSSKWDSVYNPYVAQFAAFNSAIDTRPELAGLKNNAVYKAVNTLASSETVRGGNLTSGQQQAVLSSIAELVRKRELSPQQAAGQITQYFAGAVGYNSALNKPELFSLPPQQNYVFTADGSFLGADRMKVDLLNQSAVQNYLIKNAKGKELEGFTGFGALRTLSPATAAGLSVLESQTRPKQ